MDAQGGHIDFMFLGPPYPATGSATGQTCKFVNSTLLGPEGPYKLIGRINKEAIWLYAELFWVIMMVHVMVCGDL